MIQAIRIGVSFQVFKIMHIHKLGESFQDSKTWRIFPVFTKCFESPKGPTSTSRSCRCPTSCLFHFNFYTGWAEQENRQQPQRCHLTSVVGLACALPCLPAAFLGEGLDVVRQGVRARDGGNERENEAVVRQYNRRWSERKVGRGEWGVPKRYRSHQVAVGLGLGDPMV